MILRNVDADQPWIAPHVQHSMHVKSIHWKKEIDFMNIRYTYALNVSLCLLGGSQYCIYSWGLRYRQLKLIPNISRDYVQYNLAIGLLGIVVESTLI